MNTEINLKGNVNGLFGGAEGFNKENIADVVMIVKDSCGNSKTIRLTDLEDLGVKI